MVATNSPLNRYWWWKLRAYSTSKNHSTGVGYSIIVWPGPVWARRLILMK